MKRGRLHNNFKRTVIVTVVSSLLLSSLAVYIQLNGQRSVIGCSYLDPITIDLLAFIAGLFLVVEGFARIIEHRDAFLKRQSTRIIRIAGGCAIMTLHILQFVHK